MTDTSGKQTGGEGRQWLFDHNQVESINPIASKLVHHDEYFVDEYGESTLALVLDKLLEELPVEQAEAVRLVYLSGVTLREAGRTLGIDHKTVKARADKGIKALRRRLTDSVWLADLLSGMVPSDEVQVKPLASPDRIAQVLSGLTDRRKK